VSENRVETVDVLLPVDVVELVESIVEPEVDELLIDVVDVRLPLVDSVEVLFVVLVTVVGTAVRSFIG